MTETINTLQLTDNSKTKFKHGHYNTFGLNYGLPSNGGTCPGATSGPGGCLHLKREGGVNATCYMANLVKAYPSFRRVLDKNTKLLQGKTQAEMVVTLTNTVNLFIKLSKNTDLYFRISTSGDFFSEDYAKAWAEVISQFPQVQFWVYTRSLWAIPILVGCSNLALYISSDNVNFKAARQVFEAHKHHNNLGISYMGNTEALPKNDRWVVCPQITGKVPNTPGQGACAKCCLCFTYNGKIRLRNINFPIH